MKTWKDIRGEILRLGARSEARYEEEPMLFVEAVNRAMAVVCAALAEPLPEPLTAFADDAGTPLLSTEAAVAVPLLAAFYVYEDEDERKAVRFREDAYELIRRFAAVRRGNAEILADNGTSI